MVGLVAGLQMRSHGYLIVIPHVHWRIIWDFFRARGKFVFQFFLIFIVSCRILHHPRTAIEIWTHTGLHVAEPQERKKMYQFSIKLHFFR